MFLAFDLYFKSNYILKTVFFIIFVVLAILAIKLDSLLSKFNRNFPGQDRVGRLFKLLPEEFIVLQDFKKSSVFKIDYIILGPTGVYCFLALDWAGEIKSSGRDWSANGVTYPNPVSFIMEQVKIIGDRVEEILNKKVPVQPVIVFSNPQAKLKSMSYSVPLIKFKGLTKYLNTNLTGRQILTSEEIEKLAQIKKL